MNSDKLNHDNMRAVQKEIMDNVLAIRGETYKDCLGAMVCLLTKADIIQHELMKYHKHDPETSVRLCELLSLAIFGVAKSLNMKDDEVSFPDLLNHARTVIESITRAGTLAPEV